LEILSAWLAGVFPVKYPGMVYEILMATEAHGKIMIAFITGVSAAKVVWLQYSAGGVNK
jgi:hypothetical protein